MFSVLARRTIRLIFVSIGRMHHQIRQTLPLGGVEGMGDPVDSLT